MYIYKKNGEYTITLTKSDKELLEAMFDYGQSRTAVEYVIDKLNKEDAENKANR